MKPEARTWRADNGDGTFTNPLFYEEFSDPDIIRVDDYFYMTGTTMHCMPGLPILRSTDLVNWTLLSYALQELDLGPEFRLERGEIYGQGIWAPCLRHRDGTFYIFSTVNGRKTQIFTATDPAGPWSRSEADYGFYDLGVLFDDDGRAYVVWGYRQLQIAELDATLHRIKEGTQRELTPATSQMGEGAHFYKFNGKYFITSAWFEGHMRMPCARADRLEGPWEVNPAISCDEDFGLAEGYRIAGAGLPFTPKPPFDLIEPNPSRNGRMNLHQGGIVDTPDGEWWGWSMMDYNSLGRLTCLSPVTWHDGWPYFGLPGNLGRTPRTWIKPRAKQASAPSVPFPVRGDHFDSEALSSLWQWNHVPVHSKWSLAERPGYLRLKTSPAPDFWLARNTLTQRAIGPISTITVKLDGSGLQPGDVAGLALLGMPWRWIGLRRKGVGLEVVVFDYQTGETVTAPLEGREVWLRAHCNFLTEAAQFGFSQDGSAFTDLGHRMIMVFQLKTFQGIRYSLFAYTVEGQDGGFADFDSVDVNEPFPSGLMKPIPAGQQGRLVLANDHSLGLSFRSGVAEAGVPADVSIEPSELGRVRIKSGDRLLSANAAGFVSLGEDREGTEFQWMETPTGEVTLMSIATNRFLRMSAGETIRADSAGPSSDAADGTRFRFLARS